MVLGNGVGTTTIINSVFHPVTFDQNATVGDGSQFGGGTNVKPQASVGMGVTTGEHVFIGTKATVNDGKSIRKATGPMSPYPFALYKTSAAGDLNSDGLPDLLTANSKGIIEIFANLGPAEIRRNGQPFLQPFVLDDLGEMASVSNSFLFPVFISMRSNSLRLLFIPLSIRSNI